MLVGHCRSDRAQIARTQPWRIASRLCVTALAVVSSCLVIAAQVQADEPNPVSTKADKGSSSKAERVKALGAIPLDKLEDDMRRKLGPILDDTTIYRRMPIEVVRCDPEFYLFLVNRPDTVVSIWEILGISEVALRQTGKNSYRADDGHGTLADVEYLYRSHDCHLILAEGNYQGPLFTHKVKGKCLMMLRSGYVRETDGYHYVTHRLDMFCRLDNAGIEVLAKTFQPLMGKVADRNFAEVSSFLGSLSRKAETDPQWSQRMASKMEFVHPTVREAFSKLTAKIAEKAAEKGRPADGLEAKPAAESADRDSKDRAVSKVAKREPLKETVTEPPADDEETEK